MDSSTMEKIRELLEAGRLRREIAEKVGVSPSTITRCARVLGFPDKGFRPSDTDWTEVQAYYDTGRTIDECRERFGFTYGAWDKAATRGDIVPRRRAGGALSNATRDSVEHLLALGSGQAEIARELGLTKSTVAFHMRNLGVRADLRFARRYDWNAVQRAIGDEDLSATQCMARFGFSRDSWNRAVERGDIVPRPHLIPLDELLVEGRTQTSRTHLKRRLIDSGLKENRCERCGITSWQGEPMMMQLHHISGDGLDNRLENLEFLCPNCHSLTENWGGRNGHRKRGRGNRAPAD